MSKGDKGAQFQLVYLSADQAVLEGTMKSAAQTGVISLMVFRYVLAERYQQIGLLEQLAGLANGL